MKYFLFFCLLFSTLVYGQNGNVPAWNSLTDNTVYTYKDSTSNQSDTLKKPHSVKKAVLLSIIPGGGQIYNHLAMPKGKKKAFWKVPLIYAGLGATGYFLITNQKNVKSLEREYDFMKNNNGEHTANSEWSSYDQQGVLTLHGQYQTWRDLSILAVGIVYGLQLLDAGVEAHFVNFDVSQDLSLGLDPVMLDYRTAGLRMSLNFR